MSAPLAYDDVLFWQRLYAAEGLYQGKLDGIHGPKTELARLNWEYEFKRTRSECGTFDARTEHCIFTLLGDVQRKARQFLISVIKTGVDARILSGTRTYAEQAALYRQGRYGDKQRIVTRARAGQSNHNFGLAWDVGIFQDGAYVRDDVTPYEKIAPLRPEGIEWGGDWASPDVPHYQLALELTLPEIRRRFESGIFQDYEVIPKPEPKEPLL